MDWLRKPLKIADFIGYDRTQVMRGSFTVGGSLDKKAELGFNCEHFAYYKVDRLGRTFRAFEETVEILPKYLKAAHKRGIRVFVYLNVHWYPIPAAEKHPDWFQIDHEGGLIDDVYGNGVMSCVNTPWREVSYDQIREIAKSGPDGIFLDGPAFLPKGCYCNHCRERFERIYGKPLPRKGDLRNPNHRLLVEFQKNSITEYMRGAYIAAKEIDPKVAIYLNGEPLRPNWSSGRDNRRLEPYQDLAGAEGGFIYGKLMETPIFKPGMTAKGLEAQAPNKPRVIFVAAKHCPWNRNLLTPAELKILCAETLANGANYWIGYGYPDARAEETIKEINGWVAENEEYFSGTVNAARVGLYWSSETANIYGGEVPESDFTGRTIRMIKDYMKSFLGAYELLQRTHTPFKVVDKPKDIRNLELLLLPNCAVLTDRELKAIENYVRSGGNAVASFETSLYEGVGKLEDFALAEVLGVRYLGIEEYGAYENYLKMDENYLPAYTHVVKVQPTTSDPLASISENTRGYYQPIVFKDYPGICENVHGNGRSIYFAGNYFQTYYDYKFHKYVDLSEKLLRRVMKPRIIVENAPRGVEVTLRRKNHVLLLHLINFSSELKRPIEDVIPLRDITVKVSGVRAEEVQALIGEKVTWANQDGLLELSVPLLREYEVIAIHCC